jgi:hypothetical protein
VQGHFGADVLERSHLEVGGSHPGLYRPEGVLHVFYGIRSERQLMEQLDYNLLYRWFVGLSPDDPVWDPTTFTKNVPIAFAGLR